MEEGSSQRLSDEEAKTLIDEMEHIRIAFTQVGYFTPNARFLHADFAHISSIAFTSTSKLFTLTSERLCEATDFYNILSKINPTKCTRGTLHGPQEKECLLSIIHNLLSFIGDKVYLALMYTKELAKIKSDNVEILHMGIGSQDTLHGYPDCKIRGKEGNIHIVFSHSDEDNNSTSNSNSPTSSLGDSVVVEGKRCTSLMNTDQLIATTVVTSFIQNNRHPHLNSLVPVIMICVPTAQICFYDCAKDVLLLSDKFEWLDTNNKINKAAILLLWITVNHRIFLKVFPDVQETHKSTIEANLKQMNHYEHFKRLRNLSVTFIQNKTSGKDMEIIEYETTMPPPLKKYKTV